MEIEILEQQCGGTEFVPSPHRLHLGAQNAEGVDRLQFILPAAWAECTLALYLRRSDGVQLAAIPLDTDGSVTVDRRLTGSVRGQWMLAAMGSGGYTAYTRPGSYDVYATLPTDGGSEELPPTLYEQFVARVLESASTSATAAQKAAASAARCSDDAAKAQTAARQTYTNSTACPAEPVAGALLRVLSVDPNTGALHTDTTPMPDFSPFVRSSTVPTAQTSGAVRADAQYGVSVRTDGTLTTVPADAGQLDAMTDAFAPLVPALLPYGVKKALTSASTAAGWSAAEKAAALRTLGADLSAYYTRNEADARFGAPYTLPAATADVLGGVKAGSNLTVYADGTLALLRSGVTGALGYTPAQVTAGTADLTAGSSALTTGAVYLVYQ